MAFIQHWIFRVIELRIIKSFKRCEEIKESFSNRKIFNFQFSIYPINAFKSRSHNIYLTSNIRNNKKFRTMQKSQLFSNRKIFNFEYQYPINTRDLNLDPITFIQQSNRANNKKFRIKYQRITTLSRIEKMSNFPLSWIEYEIIELYSRWQTIIFYSPRNDVSTNCCGLHRQTFKSSWMYRSVSVLRETVVRRNNNRGRTSWLDNSLDNPAGRWRRVQRNGLLPGVK